MKRSATKSSITLPPAEFRLVTTLKVRLGLRSNVDVVRRGLHLLQQTDRSARTQGGLSASVARREELSSSGDRRARSSEPRGDRLRLRIEHGGLYAADLNPPRGTEPGTMRPVVVVQSNLLNEVGHPSRIVLPCTTRLTGRESTPRPASPGDWRQHLRMRGHDRSGTRSRQPANPEGAGEAAEARSARGAREAATFAGSLTRSSAIARRARASRARPPATRLPACVRDASLGILLYQRCSVGRMGARPSPHRRSLSPAHSPHPIPPSNDSADQPRARRRAPEAPELVRGGCTRLLGAPC